MHDDGESMVVVLFLIITCYQTQKGGENHNSEHEKRTCTGRKEYQMRQSEGDGTHPYRHGDCLVEDVKAFVFQRLQDIHQKAAKQKFFRHAGVDEYENKHLQGCHGGQNGMDFVTVSK